MLARTFSLAAGSFQLSPLKLTLSGLRSGATSSWRSSRFASGAVSPPMSTPPAVTPLAISSFFELS